MNTLKKNWPFLLIALISLGLGILAVLTAIKLKEEKPIAPTAPASKPKAVEGSPVPECQTSFTLTITTASPSPTPTATPGTSPSPSPSPSASPSSTPNISPSPSVTPTPRTSPSSTPSTPEVPKAGTTWPTAFLMLGAAALLLLGLALP